MTEIRDPLPSCRDDAQFLLRELACVSGTLSEIMTMWRRARPFRPQLELGRLTRLQDAVRQLAAEIEGAACASPWPPPDLVRSLAERIPALEEDIAAARTLASGPCAPGVGDARLWESAVLALGRARTRLAALAPGAGPR
jgi:hypothetical protein